MIRVPVTAAVLLLAAYASANFATTPVEDHIKASDDCIVKLNISPTQAAKLRKLEYDDSKIVGDYLLCKCTAMGIWNDITGIDIDLVSSYFKNIDREDLLSPELNDCNSNAQKDPPIKWIRRAMGCILESPVGEFFKKGVAEYHLKTKQPVTCN